MTGFYWRFVQASAAGVFVGTYDAVTGASTCGYARSS
ncbi:hypothetical protein SUDANB1_07041 [Streptomyces sp. enrichment culture]